MPRGVRSAVRSALAVLVATGVLSGCGAATRPVQSPEPYNVRVAQLVAQTHELYVAAAGAVSELAAGQPQMQAQAQTTLRDVQQRAQRLAGQADRELSTVSPVASVIEQASNVVAGVAQALQQPHAAQIPAAGLERLRKALAAFAAETHVLNSQSGAPLAAQVEIGLQGIAQPAAAAGPGPLAAAG